MRRKFNIWGYIKDYKFNSILIKNIASLFLLIIIPIIGFITLTFYAYNNIQKSEMKAYNEGYITKLSGDMDRIIKEAKAQLIYIGFNSDVELFIYSSLEQEDSFYKINNIFEIIKLPIISKGYINSIYIYSPKIEKIISHQGIANFDDFLDRVSIENYLSHEDNSTGQWIALTDTIKNGEKTKQLSIYHNINLGSRNNGVVVMNINLLDLEKVLNNNNYRFYITDDQMIFLSSDPEQIGQSVDIIENYMQLLKNKGYTDKKNSVTLKKSDETGLYAVSYFDLSIYQEKLQGIRNFMFLLIMILVLTSIILCFIISIKMFHPIKTIMSTIEKNKTVLFGEDSLFGAQNELKYIVESIERTIDKSKSTEDELAKRLQILKKAKSIALQSQINPHFFNNTLQSINMTAISLLGHKNDISEMTEALSLMLRIALDNTDTIISFKDELVHAKMYLAIQKRRYADKFDVIWDIDKNILNCKTIKIILQPLIENAIYHGIKPLSDTGTIIIKGKIVKGTVTITITDNGLGIAQAEIDQLNVHLKSEVIKESQHIGLTNVNQRIKLYFGDEYGIEIASTESVGTTVAITLPHIE